MEDEPPPWSLESLIDFEQAIGAAVETGPEVRAAVVGASRGLSGAEGRRRGLRVWLEEVGERGAGRKFCRALGVLGGVLWLLMFLAGSGAVVGLFDREKGGINVVLFLAILIGGQWLFLLGAGVVWVFRGSAAEGFGGVRALIGMVARRFPGQDGGGWWERVMEGGGGVREVLLWRIARLAQALGVGFNVGILAGVCGLVMVRHVGFFWETTTEFAMREVLVGVVGFLSLPWSGWWPGAVPDGALIDATRWLPGNDGVVGSDLKGWWEFLVWVTLVWGLFPRVLLWWVAWQWGRRVLGRLDFQSRSHRVLWRELHGAERSDVEERPLDGVLVLDVGGNGLTCEMLRPFLLQRLRVHPAAWHPVAVMDEGAEAVVAKALKAAPEGVVLLDQGWALSPARMRALHGKVRQSAGPDAPIKFLIVNGGAGGGPVAPREDELREWERFVDGLKDPNAEVFAFGK